MASKPRNGTPQSIPKKRPGNSNTDNRNSTQTKLQPASGSSAQSARNPPSSAQSKSTSTTSKTPVPEPDKHAPPTQAPDSRGYPKRPRSKSPGRAEGPEPKRQRSSGQNPTAGTPTPTVLVERPPQLEGRGQRHPVPIFKQTQKYSILPYRPRFIFRAFSSESGSTYSPSTGFKTNAHNGMRREDPVAVKESLVKHFNLKNIEATEWISTTDNLLNALWRACRMRHKGKKCIGIAVISTALDIVEIQSAEALSKQYNLLDPHLKRAEWLFYASVPRVAIVACVSLKHLETKKLYEFVPPLNCGDQLWKSNFVSLEEMREAVKKYTTKYTTENPNNLDQVARWTNEGLTAGEVAVLFGNGGHTETIARQALTWRHLPICLEDWQANIVDDAIRRVLQSHKNKEKCFHTIDS